MGTATEPKDPVRPEQRADGRSDGGADRPPWRVEGARPKSSRLGRMTDTWVVLQHRPTDYSGCGEAVLADPRFGDHLAFLRRMAESGYLVSAGPLADRPGEGMTVLRLPGEDRYDEAVRLATQDDASVAGGFFTVDVRPWRVVMHA